VVVQPLVRLLVPLQAEAKERAIGAASGTGAGALTQILTKGKSICIPAETILAFQLGQSL
jgi:hypothetical protein